MIAPYLFGGTAAVFAAMALVTLWHLRWVRRLPESRTLPVHGADPVRCSVVVPARDEERGIERTVRQLLAQVDVELEIIVVDDRSTDGTATILRGLAREEPRLTVKSVEVLPDGWLGKCHACHTGAGVATGGWILFADGDAWLAPDVIGRAVRLADREGVDHVTLASGLSSRNCGLEAAHLVFLMSTANWFSGVNRDRPEAGLGFGAFNLVRATAYRECGGYEALRLTVLDDVRLGLLLRRAGKRTRAFIGGDDVECHWGTKARDMVKILEKNYFPALDYRTGLVMAGSSAMVVASVAVVLGLASGTPLGLAAALSPWLLIAPGAVLAKRLGWRLRSALLSPLMFPLFQFALLNSAFVTLRQGGIRWRETFYPLAILRAGNVHRTPGRDGGSLQ